MRIKIRAIILLAFCVVQLCSAVKPFEPGERVVFLGDSITHYGRWWPYIWCGYVAAFPENPPLFISAGFSGDSATGALNRLDRDVFAKNPDTVCVMLGMNDVGRSAYTAENSAADQAKKKASLDKYRESMDELLKRINDKGLRCVVVTPSPYDQTMVNPDAGTLNPGYNDGLTIAARIATELAGKYKCDVVDFHGPMTRINTEKQRKDPAASIIGMDRIHPGDEGSEIMAQLFLAAQGIDSSGLKQATRFANIWEHVSAERHLRNIVWLDDNVLKPNNIDTEDIDAAKIFLTQKYTPRGADNQRIASYCKWRGRENELYQQLDEIREMLCR